MATMILSVPRSGLHYVRYCSELFSGQMTPRGKDTRPMIVDNPSRGFLFRRSHWAWTTENDFVAEWGARRIDGHLSSRYPELFANYWRRYAESV